VTAKVPPFSELIAGTTSSAVHLEMRDAYTPADPVFLDWAAGKPVSDPAYPGWVDLVRASLARGVVFRRVRIVSEPLSPFMRFEHDITAGLNIAAGELVRWLPRRRASDLCLPGNDFWVLDDRLARFGHFAGDGEFLDHELTSDPRIVRHCAGAFEAVWQRAIDHDAYRPA
jgi:hypothetical protein